jgi:hypothetical protein
MDRGCHLVYVALQLNDNEHMPQFCLSAAHQPPEISMNRGYSNLWCKQQKQIDYSRGTAEANAS